MCATCGCGAADEKHHHRGHEHSHPHDDHHHTHERPRVPFVDGRVARTVRLETDLLAKNDVLASRTRELLSSRRIAAFNFVSSPGSGKTTLLEQTIRRVSGRVAVTAIEGDQETERDADRLRATGCRVVQINTGAGCHLDAEMVAGGLRKLEPPDGSLLLIENVGNLVCPALFDLGERAKVAVISVTEGEDKPLKYPHMFRASSLLVVNKIDLLPYVQFDVERCISYARRVNPTLQVFQVSAIHGDGLDDWCDWLTRQVAPGETMAC